MQVRHIQQQTTSLRAYVCGVFCFLCKDSLFLLASLLVLFNLGGIVARQVPSGSPLAGQKVRSSEHISGGFSYLLKHILIDKLYFSY